jgi:chromosome segregation ATPase
MKIFNNNKTFTGSDDNISLSDYDRKIAERKEEYDHLNEILRGMRAEVSNLMNEIKNVTDNLVKRSAELYLLEETISDLKRSYELLRQNVKYEEEAFSKANNELTKIKNEINKNTPYHEKLIAVRKEYKSLSLQLIKSKNALEKIKNQDYPKTDAEVENGKEKTSNLTIVKKKKCMGKTKSGTKCKRFAVEGSIYCSYHA